jgi:SAM-dependent methyltransferase
MQFKASNEFERQALELYEPLITGWGGMDVLQVGLSEQGLLADCCAATECNVIAIDPDGNRVIKAREASKIRRNRAELDPKLKPTINQSSLSTLDEKFTPGSFDVALIHLELAREPYLESSLGTLYWLLRTDGIAAISFPHPCFNEQIKKHFEASDYMGEADWVPGKLYHRSLGAISDAADEIGFQLLRLREYQGPAGHRHARSVILMELGKDKWAP